MPSPEWKPTRQQLEEARGQSVPDLISRGLDVLFCGINPGLYSGAVEHHFARPGNRFWPALHLSGFTPRRLSPFEEEKLPAFGVGITNIVERATASAAELEADEIRAGGRRLVDKVRRYSPRFLAVLGVGAYRVAFDVAAKVGPQEATIGDTRLWVLPNPSGVNAHYQLDDLVAAFGALRVASVTLAEDAGSASKPTKMRTLPTSEGRA